MSSRTINVGIAVSVIAVALLLTGCNATGTDTGPSPGTTAPAARTTEPARATTPTSLSPSIIGQAEKHHTAVLTRALADTALDEKQWIVLNQALAAGAPVDRAAHITRITGLTQWDPADVETALTALLENGLLQATSSTLIEPTATGTALADKIRAESGKIVAAAYSAVTPEDLATAARVLTTITARMAAELAHR
ncbi:hypothetical protein [Nocardia sp. NPDC058480]|uniref:hypothetical protein n=1 Tax=unclassified Nocardia TaxID=2637762 RepID=UPI003652188E